MESKDDSVEKIKKVTIIENPKEMNGVVNDERYFIWYEPITHMIWCKQHIIQI